MSAYNNGVYVTVNGQNGKRWRVLPDLLPPRSLEELSAIRAAAVASRKGGGVPPHQLEPDPFGLCKKLAAKSWVGFVLFLEP